MKEPTLLFSTSDIWALIITELPSDFHSFLCWWGQPYCHEVDHLKT